MTKGKTREKFQGKKILITGGLGFIGSNLTRRLLESGAKVTIVDAVLPGYGGNRFNLEGIETEVEVIKGDIRDWKLMTKVVEGAEYVFHLAGQVSYLDSKAAPFDDLDFNGRGTLTVLEAVRQKAPKARVLHASSRLVYGRILALPVKEDHPTNPLSLYGIHKLLGEKYLCYYAHEYGLSTVSVRIPNPYGPRQQMKHSKYSIVGWFIRQALDDQTIKIFGDGQQERDYLYIDDLTAALMLTAAAGESGEVYNVGTHERVKFADMVEAVVEAAGQGKIEYVPWPENYERNETGDYIADTEKLFNLTGWRPKTPLAEGIARTVEFYRQHRGQYWQA